MTMGEVFSLQFQGILTVTRLLPSLVSVKFVSLSGSKITGRVNTWEWQPVSEDLARHERTYYGGS